VIPHANVRSASDPSLDQLRGAVTALVTELMRHLGEVSALPSGPTSYARLAHLHEPVLHAVARWDQAVFDHTQTFPVAVDDGWSDDLSD
jgi:hypothetical protein